jgi:hypothetical protein
MAAYERRGDYHAALQTKYERAARYPWLAVEPDRPEPGRKDRKDGQKGRAERTGRKDRQRAGARWAERTGNAQAPDDRNWLKIQVLELRVQTIRSVSARFTLHVFSPQTSRQKTVGV